MHHAPFFYVYVYVYGLGLIGQEVDGEYTSYHFDYRGSTVTLTDKNAQIIEQYQYSPYGHLLSGDASKTPFLFNGKYGVITDSNGLYYMRARFYSPEIKRFVNQDILLGGINEGQTLNRYAFVTGQPVSFVDPFGLKKNGNCGTSSYECMIYGLDDPSMREFGEQLLDIIPGDLTEIIWICNRPINELYGQILPNHKYVCCDGENQNCYGHRLNDLMPGDEI